MCGLDCIITIYFGGCKTNKPCDICRWVGWAECLPSSLSIVWKREVKHLEIDFFLTEDLTRRMHIPGEIVTFEAEAGSYFGVPGC